MTTNIRRYALLVVLLASPSGPASAQAVESIGTRALGMGGAFVAVANDSSATWWNPAGQAAGPFFDGAISWARTDRGELPSARRDRVSAFALSTLPIGVSYYRLRVTDIAPVPTAGAPGRREDGLAGVSIRAFSASQFGVTLVQSLFSGVHVGTTLKYVRGRFGSGLAAANVDMETVLEMGEAIDGGAAQGRFDLDVGVIAVGGPFRVGGVVKNLREPAFGGSRIARQVRAGAAFDAGAVGDLPLTVSLDADVVAYPSGSGDRRVVAIGAEQWLLDRRLALRAGGRINTAGDDDRAVTGGASLLVRWGLYVDGHVVGGGAGERGWGLAARVSF